MNPTKKIEGWNYSVFTNKKTDFSEKVRRNNERNALMMMQKALNLPTDFHGKFSEVISILEVIQVSINENHETMRQLSSGGNNSGGGGGMDDQIEKIKEKISTIETNVAVTEVLVKEVNIKLDKMDAKLDKLSSKDFVEYKINESQNSLLKWMIVTAIATTGVTSGIVFGIIKLLNP